MAGPSREHAKPIGRRSVLKGVAAAGGAALTAPAVAEWLLSGTASGQGRHRGTNGAPKGPTQPTTPQVVVDSGLGYPLGLFVVPGGPIYVADFGSVDGTAPGRILAVDPTTATVATVITLPDSWPSDVAVDGTGNIWFTDYGWDADDGAASTQTDEGGRVMVVPASTLAGTPTATPLATGLIDPSYLFLDEARNVLYVSDTGEAGGGGNADPSGTVLAYPWTGGASPALGAPTVVAGTGSPIVNGVGVPGQPVNARKATTVTIFVAFGLAAHERALYIGDEYAHVVYRLDTSTGRLRTYAGNGTAPNLNGTGDGGPATSASVPFPQGLTVDGAGNLYILQIEGQVRRVDARSGVITTVSAGPYVSDNVGIKFDPDSGSLYYVQNDYPVPGALYEVT